MLENKNYNATPGQILKLTEEINNINLKTKILNNAGSNDVFEKRYAGSEELLRII